MAFTIVTGRSDQDHVTSDDMGNLYALTQGSGRYALDDIECTVIDANTVHVSAGNLLIDGRHFRNSAEGTNLNIANGLPGMNRIDLIVAQYTYETIGEDYLEYGNLVVIQGTPTSGTPEVPECEGGSILNNDAIVEVPLFTIPITGVAVGTPSDCLLSAYELPIDRGGTGGGTAAAARAGLSVPSKADLGNVAASVAPVEQSTATANHAVGSYLILDNVLYKVTTAIATGETIAEGTNVTATDLNTELGAIRDSLEGSYKSDGFSVSYKTYGKVVCIRVVKTSDASTNVSVVLDVPLPFNLRSVINVPCSTCKNGSNLVVSTNGYLQAEHRVGDGWFIAYAMGLIS